MNDFLDYSAEELQKKREKNANDTVAISDFLKDFTCNKNERETLQNTFIKILNDNFYLWKIEDNKLKVISKNVEITNTNGLTKKLGDYLLIFSHSHKINTFVIALRIDAPFYYMKYNHSHFSYHDKYHSGIDNSCFGAAYRIATNPSIDDLIMHILSTQSLLTYESTTTMPYRKISSQETVFRFKRVSSTQIGANESPATIGIKIINKKVKSTGIYHNIIPFSSFKLQKKDKPNHKRTLQISVVFYSCDYESLTTDFKEISGLQFDQHPTYKQALYHTPVLLDKSAIKKQDEHFSRILINAALIYELEH